jgi:HK97 family phage major capsid protein
MDPELLKQLDKKLESVLGSSKAAQDAVDEIRAEQGKGMTELQAKVLALQTDLKSAREHSEKLEADFNARRFNGGVDELKNAIPDEHRSQIDVVRLSATVDERLNPTLANTNAIEQLKKDDPIKYVACASWLHSRLMRAVSQTRSDAQGIVKYHERAEKLGALLGQVDKAALAETTNVGAEFVPTIVEALIGRVIKDNSVVRRSGPTTVQMTSQTHNLPRLDTNFSQFWTAEGASISDSAPTTYFSSVALTAKKNTGLATASIEVLQDSIVNINDFFLVHLGEMMGRAEDQQGLEGTGTVFTGLGSATGVNSVAGTSVGITLSTLMATAYKAEDESTRDGGVWFSHPWVVRDALQLTTGTAGTPWLPLIPFQNQGRTKDLLGFPVFATSVIARSATTTSTTTLYFGNPKGIVFGDRMGTMFDVDPYGLFTTAQVRLRVIRRTGIAVWVPPRFTKATFIAVS